MFTSYAQNFEDVMLWRALQDIEAGFYIDIGAQDPIVDSVSRGFYEKGWRGLSVEPTSTYSTKLSMDRPDEQVLQCAVGAGASLMQLFEFPDTGLSTGDAAIAASHRERGFLAEVTTVKVVSLGEILDRYLERDIHWLKIDVEGMEKSVLESWGESSQRPWIVVVESTEPMSPRQLQSDWELLLLQRGYEQCYFDGLNSYFLHDKRTELRDAFRLPPNVFDRFEFSGKSSSNMTSKLARDLDASAHELKAQTDLTRESRRQVEDLMIALDNTHNALAAIKSSFSWRITKPYRVTARAARRMSSKLRAKANRLRRLPGRLMKLSISILISFVKERPRLRSFVLRVIYKNRRWLSPLISLARSQGAMGFPITANAGAIELQIWRSCLRSFELADGDYSTLSRAGRLSLSRLSHTVRRSER